ncbi:hypothetical protein DACRYDRAFT_24244 [Dacryopinax primogenitus]|uniref:Uncharacterized protein n=1 Tax=Dacryopinax primogenitus (strain DJM 731) TaxID=1858805 RepID=M5FTC8_DACPD|nr:uncharacterized protein DACRYDRAFT_24244 [Dacryopinax primogenitus]EJT98634.1 hypothetical protein DACRYDRAFT_24244 [Dacryopinax primogenitus]
MAHQALTTALERLETSLEAAVAEAVGPVPVGAEELELEELDQQPTPPALPLSPADRENRIPVLHLPEREPSVSEPAQAEPESAQHMQLFDLQTLLRQEEEMDEASWLWSLGVQRALSEEEG